uniref:Uncharacterized protein n=1 Tax=Amphimedon queenslandica TaxID=400682 RepID=A0A1X7SNV3_AMPQE
SNKTQIESQATSTYRKTGIKWSKPYFALDGTDANLNTLDTVIFPPTKPWLQLDITEAAQNWKNGERNLEFLFGQRMRMMMDEVFAFVAMNMALIGQCFVFFATKLS